MINIIQIIDTIGVSGPIVLGISSLILLYNKSNLFSVYIIGFIINSLLNILLKGIIKQPRPSEDIHMFNIKLMSGKRIGYDKFGMPSGHAQSVFYSTLFILFALKNNIITFFYFIISFLTIYQRIKYFNHDIYQVIIGSIIGSILGFSFYTYTKELLKGNMKMKMDDNAPI